MDDAFEVVRNNEDQYSIWPATTEPPPGWTRAGFTGGRSECLDHIDTVWTDMRPRSVRVQMT
jgi:MbtH protein